ncbi:MAG: peptidoglycan DL-endopeptidase CwlO [Patescibacteria group bacterium]|nr:peptidoglycan DL-endopeptidase CwlO [Patescibacteria group bacterium]
MLTWNKMNLRSTTPTSVPFAKRAAFVAAAVLMIAATPLAVSQVVDADQYDARIAQLQAQIEQYNAQAAALSRERNTYENKLAQLNAEKAQIQAQIDLNEAKANQLTEDIKKSEAQIAANKDALGETLADLYVDDNISAIEMLASSNNISDYVDKQAYREAIQDELSATISKIKELKKQLEEQKLGVERALADQKSAREALSAKEAEQQQLIAQVAGQEQAYQNLSAQTKAEKDRVMAAQQAAIAAAMARAGGGGQAVAGDPSKGGYPAVYANSDYYNPVVDQWGMYSRQCVSYTAWKVYQKNGYMPYWGGRGNANQWPGNARAAGIPVSSTPRAGSVGVIMAGQYGHVVWVESVNGDGTINISQYNYYNAGGSGWGHYSEMYSVSPAAYDYYIHF